MNGTIAVIALAAAGWPDLQSLLDQLRIDQDVPGISAAVTVDDRVLFAGGSGLADVETGREMHSDTRVYAGSLSKVLTAVLALRLVETGLLELDEPADLPVNSRAGEPVTIAHLLTHASGLVREGDFGYWYSGEFPDPDALRAYLQRTALRAPPGSDFHYSNIGYAALGLVIESRTAQPYARALRDRILRPLGMQASGAPGPVHGLSRGYTPRGRLVPGEARPFAGVGAPVGGRRLREYHDAAAMSPAFGIYTTAEDFSRLARFLLGFGGDDILSPARRRSMLAAQASGWGLGIKIGRIDGRPVASHSGWFAAHRSHLLLAPEAGIGVVVFANSDAAAPGVIAESLLAAVLEAGTGQAPRDASP